MDVPFSCEIVYDYKLLYKDCFQPLSLQKQFYLPANCTLFPILVNPSKASCVEKIS